MTKTEKVYPVSFYESDVFLKTWQNSKLAYFMSKCSLRTDKNVH